MFTSLFPSQKGRFLVKSVCFADKSLVREDLPSTASAGSPVFVFFFLYFNRWVFRDIRLCWFSFSSEINLW